MPKRHCPHERFTHYLRAVVKEIYYLGGASEDEIRAACIVFMRGLADHFEKRIGKPFPQPVARE